MADTVAVIMHPLVYARGHATHGLLFYVRESATGKGQMVLNQDGKGAAFAARVPQAWEPVLCSG